jgi:tetrahydromethanopterin S-methyltransferase subunit C
MKKLMIITIIFLLGIYLFNALPGPAESQSQTLGVAVANLQNLMSKFKVDDLTTLNSKVTPEELIDSAKLVKQWKALLKVSKEAGKIISGR